MQELFFKLNKLHRILIVSAVAFILLGLFYFFVIDDMITAIKGLETEIEKINRDIASEENTKKQGPELKRKIEAEREKLKTMVASLPEKQEIDVLLREINNLITENNLATIKFTPGQEQVNEELYYAQIPVDMQVKGDFRKQGLFLSNLNSLPRIVNVPSLKLKKGASSETVREKNLQSALEVVILEAGVGAVTYRRLSDDEIQAIVAKKQAKKK